MSNAAATAQFPTGFMESALRTKPAQHANPGDVIRFSKNQTHDVFNPTMEQFTIEVTKCETVALHVEITGVDADGNKATHQFATRDQIAFAL